MHWRISWCVESTCWLTFTDWCIGMLIGVLDWHVCWHVLTDALTCWLCAESTCWLTCWLCVELTYWLLFTDWCIDVSVVCWVDMLVDVNCFAQFICCGPVVAFDRYKKKKEKKLYIYYIFKAGWKPSFCCSCKNIKHSIIQIEVRCSISL